MFYSIIIYSKLSADLVDLLVAGFTRVKAPRKAIRAPTRRILMRRFCMMPIGLGMVRLPVQPGRSRMAA
jgi:hypothetical protein